MDIEFDPAKDTANIARHGLSLTNAGNLDLLTAAVIVDDRQDYGEPATAPLAGSTGRAIIWPSRCAEDASPDQLPAGP